MTIAVPVSTGEELRARLVALAAHVLQLQPTDIAASTEFASLGLDSLGTLELVALIEDEFHIELPATSLFDHPTVGELATLVETLRAGREAVTDIVRQEARIARMLADAELPPEILPGQSSRATARGAVLLTGATGFMGAFILRELLRDTALRVVCLVRRNGDASERRVRRNLERYGLWDEGAASRIRCVDGDLGQPLLGLSAPKFSELAISVDEIYHAGAAVDWVQPYDQLRDTNVLGTRELLRLACAGPPKPFHFLSSLTVCISTHGELEVDERDDPLRDIAGLHLGYAQTKCVAEALVRSAQARGLPVTIVRPALVTGASISGISNPDDLVSMFIRGCIHMRAAPDLDWVMDSVPVDHAAGAFLRLARLAGTGGAIFHLANPKTRHWRECVLWMRLRGYPLDLYPYREWCELLRRTATGPSHPLYPLRSFFLHAIAEAGGRSLPELYEETARRHVGSERSSAVLSEVGIECPALDIHLLERYFESYVERGVIPATPNAGRRSASQHATRALTERLVDSLQTTMRARTGDAALRITDCRLTPIGAESSIVAELTSLRRGTGTGLFRGRFTVERKNAAGETMDVVVKSKPIDTDVIEVGEHIAQMCGRELGESYALWRDHIGFTRGHVREQAIYDIADQRLRRYIPELLGSWTDDARDERVLVLEYISDATVADAYDRTWTDAEIDTALEGLATLHSAWYGRAAELSASAWLPPRRSAALMAAMRPLWAAAAAHARPAFLAWGGSPLIEAHDSLLHGIEEWWRPLETHPQTLIHNDFNPRNIMLRGPGGGRLCAYDWELATLGAPQRDLAEFLCFVLSPESAPSAHRWVVRYRELLEFTGGIGIDAQCWDDGFRAALCDLAVDRLALYAMVHRFRPQRFLPRVMPTWLALHSAFPWPLP